MSSPVWFGSAERDSKKRAETLIAERGARVDERRSCFIPSVRRNRSFHSEQLVDAPRVDAERLVRLDIERARMRQVDHEVVGHPRRAGGEDDDAADEEDRL